MKSRLSEMRRARPLLGTLVEIGAAGRKVAAGIDEAFREIEAIHRLMSFHEADSDVSRLNRALPGEIVPIDQRTFEVLSCAQTISGLSAGAFDVTVGGKLVAQGFLPRPTGAEALAPAASFEDIQLLAGNLVVLKRRVWIDLGGIAKGYAVDRAVMALKNCGVLNGIVNAGGDLFVFGDPQPVHVRHPESRSLVFSIGAIRDLAVASSSGCFAEHREDGAITDPLIDPRHNRCVNWQCGATVIAPRCVIADALTKIVRLARRRAPRILSHFGAQALVIDRRGVRVFQAEKSGGRNLLPLAAQRTTNMCIEA